MLSMEDAGEMSRTKVAIVNHDAQRGRSGQPVKYFYVKTEKLQDTVGEGGGGSSTRNVF